MSSSIIRLPSASELKDGGIYRVAKKEYGFDLEEIEIESISVAEKVIEIPPYTFNFIAHKVSLIGGEEIVLSNREWQILSFLVKRRNIAISKNFLQEEIWGFPDADYKTLNVNMSRIRQKLPHLNIRSISKYGYIVEHSA